MNFCNRIFVCSAGLILGGGLSLSSLLAYGPQQGEQGETSAPVESAPATQPLDFTAGAFTFMRPVTWQWIPSTSAMRKAELRAENPGGRADVVFFHFGPGQGGSVQANVERWLGQFEEPVEALNAQTAVEEAGGTRVTFLQAAGTYLAGLPGQQPTPQPGFAMRGAILENPGGDVYVRMTGPQAAVEAAAQEFDAMILRGANSLNPVSAP